MGRHELELEEAIEAPADVVWKFLAEPAHFQDWMAQFESVKHGGKGPLKVGSEFEVAVRFGEHRLVSTLRVTDAKPGKRLAWDHVTETLDGHPFGAITEGRTQFELRPTEGGGTMLRTQVGFLPHGFKARVAASYVVNHKFKPMMESSLQKLKALAEEAGAPKKKRKG